MSTDEGKDKAIYKVVMDHEERYSIWPADRENALGWKEAGKTGTEQECLAYIKEAEKGKGPRSHEKEAEQHASEEETGGTRGDL